MKKQFIYHVGILLWISRENLDVLMECSKKHYDHKCRQEAISEGRLFNLDRMMKATGTSMTEIELTCSQLDTWVKIMEQARTPSEYALYSELQTTLRVALREAEKLNLKGIDGKSKEAPKGAG